MSMQIDPETAKGFRRRLVIEPGSGSVRAELEDDFHRMVVTLTHQDGVITGVRSAMPRSPWTTCEGAMAALERTFAGKRLDDPSVKQAKTLNCTHLFDLASFCASHAGESGRVTYEIMVSDPVDGRVASRLYRNGERLLDWTLEGGKFVDPVEIAGKGLLEINGWLAGLTGEKAEAARLLRWVTMMSGGRLIPMPAGMHGTEFVGSATCHTFQPETAEIARRKPNAEIDFSQLPEGPMADRAALFSRA